MLEKIENELEKLNNDRGMTIQKINQFEAEMTNLKTHLTMIEGAIQTCTYFLTGKEEVDNEVAVKS
jgi:peptidoglycan hydrolase CwlO-like protein